VVHGGDVVGDGLLHLAAGALTESAERHPAEPIDEPAAQHEL
jgi:hypothetical protein